MRLVEAGFSWSAFQGQATLNRLEWVGVIWGWIGLREVRLS